MGQSKHMCANTYGDMRVDLRTCTCRHQLSFLPQQQIPIQSSVQSAWMLVVVVV